MAGEDHHHRRPEPSRPLVRALVPVLAALATHLPPETTTTKTTTNANTAAGENTGGEETPEKNDQGDAATTDPTAETIKSIRFLDSLRSTLAHAIVLRKSALHKESQFHVEEEEDDHGEGRATDAFAPFLTEVLGMPSVLVETYLESVQLGEFNAKEEGPNKEDVQLWGLLSVEEIPDSRLPLAYAWFCLETITPLMAVRRDDQHQLATHSSKPTKDQNGEIKQESNSDNRKKMRKPVVSNAPLHLTDDFVLSVRDIANMKVVLELIFMWGIVATKGENNNQTVQDAFGTKSLAQTKLDLADYSVTAPSQYYFVAAFARFLERYTNNVEGDPLGTDPTYGFGLLAAKYVMYIILPLLQVCYDPDWLPTTSTAANPENKLLKNQYTRFWNIFLGKPGEEEISQEQRDEVKHVFESIFFKAISTSVMMNSFIGLLPVARIGLTRIMKGNVQGRGKKPTNFYWLHRCLGNLLTVLIMRPNEGIRCVINTFQERLDSERNESIIMESLGKILLSVPSSQKKQEYYTYIGDEVYNILMDKEVRAQKVNSFGYRSCVYLSEQLLKRDPDIAQATIFKKILTPFNEFWNPSEDDVKGKTLDILNRPIFCSEQDMEYIIEFIVYSVSIMEPQSIGIGLLWDILIPYIPLLMVISQNKVNTSYNKRAASILDVFFRTNYIPDSDPLERNKQNEEIIIEESKDELVNREESDKQNHSQNLVFSSIHDIYNRMISYEIPLVLAKGTSGMLQLVYDPKSYLLASSPLNANDPTGMPPQYLIEPTNLVDFINELKLDGFMGLFFLDALEYKELIEGSDMPERAHQYLSELLITILTKFDNPRELLADPKRIVRFASSMLLPTTTTGEGNGPTDMMEISLALLSAIFCGDSNDGAADSDDDENDGDSDDDSNFGDTEKNDPEIDDYIDIRDPVFRSKIEMESKKVKEQRESENIMSMMSPQQIDELLDVLTKLSKSNQITVREMAHDLKIKIVSLKITVNGKSQSNSTEGKESAEALKAKKQLKNSLKDFRSDLIPVRAYGVSVITRLIHERSPVIQGELSNITLALLELMRDTDSFVYLNVIKALAALTDVYPESTLTLIVAQYTTQEHELDYRLQIGEALLRTIQRCGEVFPRYSSKILPPILLTLHDTNKNLRASGMSLVSCIAETAPLSLLPVINQLLGYLLDVLQIDAFLVSEPAVESKEGETQQEEGTSDKYVTPGGVGSGSPVTARAALHTLFQVIDNVGDKGPELIPTETIRRVQNILTGLESNVRADKLVRSHSMKVLEILTVWLPVLPN